MNLNRRTAEQQVVYAAKVVAAVHSNTASLQHQRFESMERLKKALALLDKAERAEELDVD